MAQTHKESHTPDTWDPPASVRPLPQTPHDYNKHLNRLLCRFCDYNGDSSEDLMRHMELAHEQLLLRRIEQEQLMKRSERTDSGDVKSEPVHEAPIEYEVNENTGSNGRETSGVRVNGVKTENGEEKNQRNNQRASPQGGGITNGDRSPTNYNENRHKGIPSPPPLIRVKTEYEDTRSPDSVCERQTVQRSYSPEHHSKNYTQNNNALKSVIKTEPVDSRTPPPSKTPPEASDLRCDQCGIVFKYISTYQAHKKYYCTLSSNGTSTAEG